MFDEQLDFDDSGHSMEKKEGQSENEHDSKNTQGITLQGPAKAISVTNLLSIMMSMMSRELPIKSKRDIVRTSMTAKIRSELPCKDHKGHFSHESAVHCDVNNVESHIKDYQLAYCKPRPVNRLTWCLFVAMCQSDQIQSESCILSPQLGLFFSVGQAKAI